jgi:N-acetylmuramoyl-L-alanine amidase
MDPSHISIILDNGHGINTPGKCSPDKSLREYKYTREIVQKIYNSLISEGYKVHILVPEETDISLGTRVKRANKIYQNEKKNGNTAILISVHNNAAGNGSWTNAKGWTVWISKNASSNSKKLAQIFYSQCEKYKLQGNRSIPKEKYWTANFYILKNSNMPAVLTENLFQDNKEDVAYLLSEKGKQTIVDLHINAIKEYIKTI